MTRAEQNESPPSLATADRATVFESPGPFQGNATRKKKKKNIRRGGGEQSTYKVLIAAGILQRLKRPWQGVFAKTHRRTSNKTLLQCLCYCSGVHVEFGASLEQTESERKIK